MRRFCWLVLLGLVIMLSGCSESAPKTLEVDMYNVDDDTIGKAVITPQSKGVKIKLDLSGIEPGPHGFHVHENGKCEGPDFKSAGAHFNPNKNEHGLMNTEGAHAGDLPNIEADEAGKVEVEITAPDVTLEENKPNSLLENGGTALVIHAQQDDGMSDPAGNAGERIACGEVIKKAKK